MNIYTYINTKVCKYVKIFGYFLVGLKEMIYLCNVIFNNND